MPETDLELLQIAAREAGEIAARFWRQDPQAWDKGGGAGPVTEADLAVDTHLEARLGRARPDYGWLSEETEDNPARLDAERVFIIDPIDGTRAFIDGAKDFAHSLAIAKDGRITVAVVYLPMRDLMYTAQSGHRARLNGHPIAPSDSGIEGASVLTQRNVLDPVFWRGGRVPGFQRAFRSSLAWRLCLAAEGRFDAALSLRAAWEWDIAAGALIAECAGAIASDCHGAPMRFNNPRPQLDGLIVAGPRLHTELLGALAPMPQR